jgi:hypothetical protein
MERIFRCSRTSIGFIPAAACIAHRRDKTDKIVAVAPHPTPTFRIIDP